MISLFFGNLLNPPCTENKNRRREREIGGKKWKWEWEYWREREWYRSWSGVRKDFNRRGALWIERMSGLFIIVPKKYFPFSSYPRDGSIKGIWGERGVK